MTRSGALDLLWQDLRYAWRSLARSPGLAAMVIVSLAVGIGLHGALFSFVDRTFVRPPAGVADPSTLRRVWIDRAQGWGRRGIFAALGYAQYQALREAAGGAADVAMYIMEDRMYLGRDRTPPGVSGVYATANYFRVLGVRPVAGRFFAPDEEVMGNAANVVVIGSGFRSRHFGDDAPVVGKAIDLGLRRFTIIGVAPPDFSGLDAQAVDLGCRWPPCRDGRGWENRRGRPGRPMALA